MNNSFYNENYSTNINFLEDHKEMLEKKYEEKEIKLIEKFKKREIELLNKIEFLKKCLKK